MSAYPHKGIAWSQKEKSRAASRPKPNKNRISYIPQSLRGLRYFFVRQAFFFSPGLTHHQAKTNSRAHAPFGVCTFTLSGNAVFWYFPAGQAFHVAEGRRPSGFLLEIQTKRRYTAWTLYNGVNLLPIWFFWDTYEAFALSSGMEQSYIDSFVRYYTSPGWLAFIILFTVLGGFLGSLVGGKLVNKHFKKAGVL